VRPASEAEKARLADLFVELCRIPSPFGHEHECADRVVAELRGMGIGAEEDASGNLLARVPPRSSAGPDRSVVLCAHLDTVETDVPIEPVLVDGGWENEHDGILGADNKAALAVMLEVARRASVEGSPVGIELLFTVSEENALAGAKAFDPSRLTSDFGYVFDHATPIGEVVVASPTYFRIEASFRGKAAHAGIRPEDGRSAVLAAAVAVAAMPLGRIDDQTTANVGSIQGGVGSTNVVPERCRLLAEARSLDPARVEDVVARMVDALHDGAAHAECDVDVITEKLFTGFRVRPGAPELTAAEAALRACGYQPRRIQTGGGSDANALQAAGFPCLNLANGTERNHEPTERVSVVALEGMLDVALALLDEAAAV
jgi:tripeptide aminopeptidase